MGRLKGFFASGRRSSIVWALASAAVSAAHVAVLFSVTFPVGSVVWLFPLLFVLPGLLTMVLLPGAWRRWYRWLVLVFLAFAVQQDLMATVLFFGHAWAIYRSWFTERTQPLSVLFRPRRKPSPAPAKTAAAQKGPTTVAEAMNADKNPEPEAAPAVPAAVRKRKTGKPARAASSKKAAVQAAKTATVRAKK